MKPLKQHLNESFDVNEAKDKKYPLWIEVDTRDAKAATEIAQDLRNSPHKMDGSTIYLFKQKDEGDALEMLEIFDDNKIGYDTNVESN